MKPARRAGKLGTQREARENVKLGKEDRKSEAEENGGKCESEEKSGKM